MTEKIKHWWSSDKQWFCILVNDGVNNATVSLAAGEAAELSAALSSAPAPAQEVRPHKTMTPEEYAAFAIKGWHYVCKDVDGFGGVGVRFISPDTTAPAQEKTV